MKPQSHTRRWHGFGNTGSQSQKLISAGSMEEFDHVKPEPLAKHSGLCGPSFFWPGPGLGRDLFLYPLCHGNNMTALKNQHPIGHNTRVANKMWVRCRNCHQFLTPLRSSAIFLMASTPSDCQKPVCLHWKDGDYRIQLSDGDGGRYEYHEWIRVSMVRRSVVSDVFVFVVFWWVDSTDSLDRLVALLYPAVGAGCLRIQPTNFMFSYRTTGPLLDSSSSWPLGFEQSSCSPMLLKDPITFWLQNGHTIRLSAWRPPYEFPLQFLHPIQALVFHFNHASASIAAAVAYIVTVLLVMLFAKNIDVEERLWLALFSV